MRKHLIAIVLLAVSLKAWAQFDAQSAFYMFYHSHLNPASVGQTDYMQVSGSYRLQWIGIENAPQTGYFAFQSPFKIINTRHGAGARFMTDKIGLFSNQTAHVQYAYKFPLGGGFISAGIDLGIISVTFKGSKVFIPEYDAESSAQTGEDGSATGNGQTGAYHNASDMAIPKADKSDIKFDMALGVYYSNPKWYAGLSYSHVTRPVMKIGDYTDITIYGTMYAMAGYNWVLRNKKFTIKPSWMLKSDFRSWTMDLTLLLDYNERIRGGLSYRWGDAVGFIFGGDIIPGLQLAYAYELPASKILQASSGSHEVCLSYSFNILGRKKHHKYKSIRIL
ncbi:MAG: PorP/SprF family type IX secretion system membrane protein [Paludibacteraceae bacterium]|nr:PorP/SprF family type IX secretion system membrane protein [Paludibacteraceae bacterium]